MDILKALNALSVRTSQADGGGEDGAKPTAAAVEQPDSGRANLMAQTIMRHENISNRVHSKTKR